MTAAVIPLRPIPAPTRSRAMPLDHATRYEPFGPEDRYRVIIAGRGAGTVVGIYSAADFVTEHLVRLDSGEDVRVLPGRLRTIAETEIPPPPPRPVLEPEAEARLAAVRAQARGTGRAALRRVVARVADAWGRRVLGVGL